MKKILHASIIASTLLAVITGTVFAGSVISMSVQNNGGGVTFIFKVSGEFSKGDLKGGYVQVQGGDTLPLHCVNRMRAPLFAILPKKPALKM